jgi:hypothetical protein
MFNKLIIINNLLCKSMKNTPLVFEKLLYILNNKKYIINLIYFNEKVI